MKTVIHDFAVSMKTLAVLILLATSAGVCRAERIWWDGSKDDAAQAPGKLLTDNAGYWGECVLTGVDYGYEAEPDSPADKRPVAPGQAAGPLVDGRQATGAGMGGGRPLRVVFDFKRICEFVEWDLITPTKRVAVTIEMRDAQNAAWDKVFQRSLQECPDQEFHRVKLATPRKGRFVRLALESPGVTRLNEGFAWGDATGEVAESITPIAQGQYPVGVSFPTVTGISKSAVSDRESFYWVQSLKPEHRKQAAVWAQVPTWSAVSNSPVLPKPDAVNQPVYIVMARNERETVALALKNTLVDSPRNVEVQLGRFTGADGSEAAQLRGTIGVFGTIGDRAFGNNLGPIFEAGNLLGKSLMKKYLLNGDEIKDFPRLTLAPSGAAVLWLSVTSQGAKPGLYKASLQAAGNEPVAISVEVLDVTLPTPFALVGTYSGNRTEMFPFEYADRTAHDVSYALDSGVSLWHWGVEADMKLLRKMAAERGMKLMFDLGSVVPYIYVHNVYCGVWTKASDFTAKHDKEVAEHVAKLVERAKSLGLSYDDWFGGTGDEPGASNIEAVGAMCRLVKKADPKVNIYVNPCYWAGFDNNAVADDAIVIQGLRGRGDTTDWYRKWVDVSMPLSCLLRDRPQSLEVFSAPRAVNSYYIVSGHVGRSEEAAEIQFYRRMAWDTFSLGFNGWAFYAWYSPRGNPWNHFDMDGREPSDYQIVYPGPRGVVRTRHSESFREAWEDWRLLNLLKQKKLDAALQQALQGYKNGTPVAELRLQALRAAAGAGR